MNEQPHVEVLSRNRNSTIVVATIPVTVFTLIAAIALWQYLVWLSYGILFLLAVLGLYLCARLYIDVRRRWFESHIIPTPPHGHTNAVTWEHLPKQLPPPVQVTEVKDEPLPPVDLITQGLDISKFTATELASKVSRHPTKMLTRKRIGRPGG